MSFVMTSFSVHNLNARWRPLKGESMSKQHQLELIAALGRCARPSVDLPQHAICCDSTQLSDLTARKSSKLRSGGGVHPE
jgi:hypothetical protein